MLTDGDGDGESDGESDGVLCGVSALDDEPDGAAEVDDEPGDVDGDPLGEPGDVDDDALGEPDGHGDAEEVRDVEDGVGVGVAGLLDLCPDGVTAGVLVGRNGNSEVGDDECECERDGRALTVGGMLDGTPIGGATTWPV